MTPEKPARVTCPCCASAKAVRPYTLPRYPDDHKTHFCRDCDCEWNESLRSGSAGQWRPISEAPKIGLVLIAVEHSGERRTFVAEYSIGDSSEYWAVTHGWVGWTRLNPAWTPVAWQPLPPPPGAGEG